MDIATLPSDPIVDSKKSPSFFSKYKFTITSLGIILVAAIPVIVLSHKMPQQETLPAKTMVHTKFVKPTPLPTLTPQSADTNLNNETTQLDAILSQVDSDITSANQVDTSQDSTNGL